MLGYTAFSLLDLAQAYALMFSTPVVITILALPVLGERVRLVRGIAITLGLVGVLVSLGPSGGSLGLGHAAAIGAVLCSATSAVITRRIAASERSLTLILYPLLANVALSGSVLYFVYEPMLFPDLARMAAVGVLAMIAQLCIITAYRRAPAALVAPCQYSQFLWAMLYGFLWFGEEPTPSVLVGGAIIIGAGLINRLARGLERRLAQPALPAHPERPLGACPDADGRARPGARLRSGSPAIRRVRLGIRTRLSPGPSRR